TASARTRARRSLRPRSSCPSSRGSTSPHRAARTRPWRRRGRSGTWRRISGTSDRSYRIGGAAAAPGARRLAPGTRRPGALAGGALPHGRRVYPLDVLLHHPACAEHRRDGADGLLDDREPAPREALVVALVERRDDLVLEQVVERLGVGVVDRGLVVRRRVPFDQPAVAAVVALGP